MKRLLIGLLLAALSAAPAVAASSPPVTSSVNIVAPAGGFQGAGDVAAAAGFSHRVWYGSRAYSNASLGQRLMNVCVNNDATCVDFFSSNTTGDIVSQTIGSPAVTCPNALGTCTIKTAYNLVPSPAAGTDVTQPTIANRPLLMARAVPILGVNRACFYYPDTLASLVSSNPINWGPLPISMSAVLMNANSGYRPNNNSSHVGNAFGATSTGPILGFMGPNTTIGGAFPTQTAEDQLQLFAGSTVQYHMLDHTVHALQILWNGAASNAFIDGGPVSSNFNTGTTVSSSSTIMLGTSSNGSRFLGVWCEGGFADGDRSGANANLDANQTAYYITPTAVPTPVLDFTVDFDTGCNGACPAAGTQLGITQQGNVFDAANGFGYYNNWNYVWLAGKAGAVNSPCTTSSTGTNEGGSPNTDCTLGSKALFQIINGGQSCATLPCTASGKALQVTHAQGFAAGAQFNWGAPWLFFQFNYPAPGSLAYNVSDIEWDEILLSATSSPAAPNGQDYDLGASTAQGGTCGNCSKVGIVDAWTAPSSQGGLGGGFNQSGAGMQQQIATGGGYPCTTAAKNHVLWVWNNGMGWFADASHVFGQSMEEKQGYLRPTTGGAGQFTCLSIGVWRHFKMQVALGPNGYTKTWMNGALYNAYSRSENITSPQTVISPIATTNPALYQTSTLPETLFQTHPGGQAQDAPRWDEYLVFDNIHYRLYNR